MTWLALPALAAGVYYVLALVAAFRFVFVGQAGWPVPRAKRAAVDRPGGLSYEDTPVSILKPIYGRDPGFYEAIRSNATQKYTPFEILFGVRNPHDTALPDIQRLQREFPNVAIAVHHIATTAPNAKTGVLSELARRARYPVLLVSDSDISAPPGYLQAVTALLADPRVGMVTCLYRGIANSWASRAEALAIATEFAPSVLVARLLGVSDFALGSTMVFRAETLQRIGGFEAIADYLADDYQLGRRIAALGYRIEFAPVVVDTSLGGESFAETWRHQLRWSRTIRVSRPGGYYGYVVTHATLWSLVAFAAGEWQAGAAALGLRMIAGIAVASMILKDRYALPYFWLIPFRDLFGFAVWFCGLFGNHVLWRGQRLRLRPDGRICPEN